MFLGGGQEGGRTRRFGLRQLEGSRSLNPCGAPDFVSDVVKTQNDDTQDCAIAARTTYSKYVSNREVDGGHVAMVRRARA